MLLGGLTAERDVSVRAGEAVLETLREAGQDAVPLFVDRDVDLALRQADIEVAFLALRGRYGGDGCLQGMLELMGIPYTGSGVLATALAMNRAKAKEVLRLHNLPTAPGYLARADAPEPLLETHGTFGYPVLVRPVSAAATLAPTVARDELELEAAAEDAFRLDDQILVERMIEGRRLCVGLLDGQPLGAVEITPGAPPARAVRLPGPAAPGQVKITPARYRSLLRVAAAAYEAIGCEGPACVDLIVSERLNEVVADVDGTPLLSPTGPLARVAHGAGLSFRDLVGEILAGACLRAHGHRQNRRAMQLSFEGPDRRGTAISAAH